MIARRRLFITGAACGLAMLGAAMLFAGDEAAAAMFGLAAGGGPVASLLGAALLGFAAMNWIARGSTLGGIYGRAIVAGNQVHFVAGAIALVRHGLAAGGPAVFWVVTAFYILGAALFSALIFGTGVGDGR